MTKTKTVSPFDRAFEYTIGNEGNYSNDKHDSGGPTKYGITIGDLSKHLGRPASVQEVKDMPLNTAKLIYLHNYWKTLDLDKITNPEVAMCMFDIGVVRGIGVPPIYAQKICNAHGSELKVDGHIGPKTLEAINALSPAVFIRDFSSRAEAGFRAIVANRPSQRVFLKGWVRRAQRLLTLIGRE